VLIETRKGSKNFKKGDDLPRVDEVLNASIGGADKVAERSLKLQNDILNQIADRWGTYSCQGGFFIALFATGGMRKDNRDIYYA